MKTNTTIEKLKKEFHENKNSHVFLLETNDSDKALVDVKEVIKTILDNDKTIKNQIDNETYIELIIVRPDGKEIKKDDIQNLQKRIKTKPVISKYIVYVIMQAQMLNEYAANKLLKTIEEPNDYTIGFLISENNDMILPTIKSRCQSEQLIYEEKEEDEQIDCDEYSKIIIDSIEKTSLLEFVTYKNKDKTTKEEIKANAKIIANRIKDYYNTACNLSNIKELNTETLLLIKERNTSKELIKKCKYINKILNKVTTNMNSELLLTKIVLEMKAVKESASSRSQI